MTKNTLKFEQIIALTDWLKAGKASGLSRKDALSTAQKDLGFTITEPNLIRAETATGICLARKLVRDGDTAALARHLVNYLHSQAAEVHPDIYRIAGMPCHPVIQHGNSKPLFCHKG